MHKKLCERRLEDGSTPPRNVGSRVVLSPLATLGDFEWTGLGNNPVAIPMLVLLLQIRSKSGGGHCPVIRPKLASSAAIPGRKS